ncbi:MAG: hypothetical protein AB7P69_19055 [Candidatus Binatia bacterium]
MTESFSFYDLTLAVHSASSALVEEIRRDFSYFHSSQGEPQVQIQAHLRPPPYADLPSAPAFRFTLRSVCFVLGTCVYIDYFGQGLAIFDRQTQRCEVFSTDPDRLHEIVYLFMLSTVGQYLRSKGIHRVHALGVSYAQQGLLILLPSGGGKSTMAMHLLHRPDFLLLGEDTPLVDRSGMLLPFPLRLGMLPTRQTDIPTAYVRTMQRMELPPKMLVDVEYFRGRIAEPVTPRFLFVGQRDLGAVSEIRPLSRYRAGKALLQDLVAGRGVYQGREFLGKQGQQEWFDKGKVVAARMQTSLRLLARVFPYRFILGRDIEKNCQTLLEFLHKKLNELNKSGNKSQHFTRRTE